MSRPITFEYQNIGTCTVVALDAHLVDFDIQPVTENGELKMRIPDKTVKDCREIDGCLYLHLGNVSDAVMTDLIEKFWKLRKEKGWRPNKGMVIPDPEFIIKP